MAQRDSLDRTIKYLADREAGWVYRRDAADLLGQTAVKCIGALRAHENEADVDVKTAVNNAIVKVRECLEGTETAGRVGYSLKALAAYLAKPGVREVTPSGDCYIVDVTLKEGRKQRVYLTPFVQQSGRAMVRLHSLCGPAASEKARTWALRNNTQFSLCALALMENEGTECLALVNAFVLEWADPVTVKASVKEITRYADWLEKKLTNDDVF